MSQESSDCVRVRFAPSPTGYLHIGGARTVLFNWLVARQSGGVFILRIEDTDQSRHVEDSVSKILDDLRWLGLNWDEGPEAGGDFGPYFQSERLHLYDEHVDRLLATGDAYYALETPEELEAMREAARREKRTLSYRRPDRPPTIDEGLAAKAEGKRVVVRFKKPDEDLTIVDDILGEVTLKADQLEDFVIQKSDGFPTYHLACVVDDALMKITHVLRGQEHLMNTPKHVALQRALGLAAPRYAHLPVIFNMDGSKMSKRDKEKARAAGTVPPEIDVHDFRTAGYFPEALLNFISLLGWSPGGDRERFGLEELTSLFSLDRVGKANARFDRAKLLSFNTEWASEVTSERRHAAFRDFLAVTDSPMRRADGVLSARLLAACEGFRTFRDVESKTRFLFITEDEIVYAPKALKKVLAKGDGAGFAMLEHVLPRLRTLSDWTADPLEQLLSTVCEERQVKLGQVAQPLRVAITGTTISPAIHVSLELLGKTRTVARIERCLMQREEGTD